jgi:hypothetical protein
VFGTDEAKRLSPDWMDQDNNKQMVKRQTYNTALHQTANAITKKAFLNYLDALPAGGVVLVTNGGCGAGKGFSLENVPQAVELAKRASVVWDSAGDQNSTENTWILEEAQKRGLKVAYAYVHADPKVSWAHPKFGVVKRATSPKNGRMVDAAVFADSYAMGARNHQAFYEKHKDNPAVTWLFLQNGKNEPLSGIPQEAFVDRDELYQFAIKTINEMPDLPPSLKRGAQVGTRIWPGLAKKVGESLSWGGKVMSGKWVWESEGQPAQPAAAPQATLDDALAAWWDKEDDRSAQRDSLARKLGVVGTWEATASPKLNPDGTLASEAGQPPSNPQGTP